MASRRPLCDRESSVRKWYYADGAAKLPEVSEAPKAWANFLHGLRIRTCEDRAAGSPWEIPTRQ
jgi:hypothetical protein